MKSKEVIRLIQEIDPTGEIEVCVGNEDIHFIDRVAAYYDGCLRVLVRDPGKEPYYDVVGIKYVSKGDKIDIHTLSVKDVIWEDPDVPIDYSGLGKAQAAHYLELNEKDRAEVVKLLRDSELKLFLRWANDTARTAFPGLPEYPVQGPAEGFFDGNLGSEDPLPEVEAREGSEGHKVYDSYVDRRKKQWDASIRIGWDGREFTFVRQG